MTTVTIIYKSGAKVHLEVKELSITKGVNGLKEITWEEADPRPLFIGIDEVAAIYEGEA
jgi:hypothetical protein